MTTAMRFFKERGREREREREKEREEREREKEIGFNSKYNKGKWK
jgi:hypothetical protein